MTHHHTPYFRCLLRFISIRPPPRWRLRRHNSGRERSAKQVCFSIRVKTPEDFPGSSIRFKTAEDFLQGSIGSPSLFENIEIPKQSHTVAIDVKRPAAGAAPTWIIRAEISFCKA